MVFVRGSILMRGWLFGSMVGFGVLALAVPALEGQGKKKGAARTAHWHTSYESGREEARRTGKPLMVIFRCEP